MKQLHLKLFIPAFITLFILSACNQAGKSDSTENPLTKEEPILPQDSGQVTNRAASNNATADSASLYPDQLRKLNHKYPGEVKLFDDVAFKQQLQKLLGDSSYKFLTDSWMVETPIEIKNNIFTARACQAFNCDKINFIIAVNLSTKKMYAGIRNEGKTKIYSEDGSTAPDFSEWQKNQ